MSGGLEAGGGAEAADGQAVLYQGFDIGFADAVDFGPDDVRLPVVDECAQAIALEGPADLIEAIEGDHLFAVASMTAMAV